jgi:hypothetical protein
VVVPLLVRKKYVNEHFEGRYKMKKFRIVLFLISLVLVFSVSFSYAEMAKEGSGMYRAAKSGKLTIMKFEDGHYQANWDETGAMVVAPENSPFVNASFRTLGTIYEINGERRGTGAVTFTCPNGDKIFATVSFGTQSKAGESHGTANIIGGTGQCSGIQGKIELLPRPKVMPSQKGTY